MILFSSLTLSVYKSIQTPNMKRWKYIHIFFYYYYISKDVRVALFTQSKPRKYCASFPHQQTVSHTKARVVRWGSGRLDGLPWRRTLPVQESAQRPPRRPHYTLNSSLIAISEVPLEFVSYPVSGDGTMPLRVGGRHLPEWIIGGGSPVRGAWHCRM